MLRFRRFLSPLTLLLVAIIVAVLTLGYYSYNAASRMVAKSEESLERANRLVGTKLIDRIEKLIIDSDRTLFMMVRLDDPKEFRELWQRIVRTSPVVETVAVLDEELNIVHMVSGLPTVSLQHFRKFFQKRIVPDMELNSLPPYTHKHLHKYYDNNPYLISFIRQRSAGRDYYIALNMNLAFVVNDLFREEFRELHDSKFISIRDDSGRIIYGNPMPPDVAYVFEERFTSTLYLWHLQIAPREIGPLRKEARLRLINAKFAGGPAAR